LGVPVPEYFITSVAQLLFCLVAMWTRNERYHAIFAISMFACQISWGGAYTRRFTFGF
jgi:hypothetical protein